MRWTPNTQTQAMVGDYISEIFNLLPQVLGIDEFIAGCELVALDPFAVGVTTLPRYVTVSIREFHQHVWYNGNIDISVGDYYTVVHIRDGDRYELLSPSGSSAEYKAPPSVYADIVVDTVSMEVVIDSGTGEVVYL